MECSSVYALQAASNLAENAAAASDIEAATAMSDIELRKRCDSTCSIEMKLHRTFGNGSFWDTAAF